MTNIAQQNLHFELSENSSRDCYNDVISNGLTKYINYLNSLKDNFENEVDNNLLALNDYPLAYKYVMEALFKFESLRKYYFSSRVFNKLLKRCCKKAKEILDDTIKEIVCFIRNTNSMVCDFLILKSNLLKQLKCEYFRSPTTIKTSNAKWSKNVIDLIELAKLMKETKMVEGVRGKLTLKDLVNDLSNVFGVEIKGLYSKVSKAKSRKVLTKPSIYQVMEDYIKDN